MVDTKLIVRVRCVNSSFFVTIPKHFALAYGYNVNDLLNLEFINKKHIRFRKLESQKGDVDG